MTDKNKTTLWRHARLATLAGDVPWGWIERGALLTEGERIRWVGAESELPSALPTGLNITAERDLGGALVTPGLIDCHSHIAIQRGVNEGASSVTVEVRIADVIDPTDINIYRQLAGGVTVSHLLHGSANSMGMERVSLRAHLHQFGNHADGSCRHRPVVRCIATGNPVGSDHGGKRHRDGSACHPRPYFPAQVS